MSSSTPPPPPKRINITTASKAKSENNSESDDHNVIPSKELQEMDGSFVTNSNFTHPRWNAGEEFPPGYRFVPQDGELIVKYLQKKVNNEPMLYNRIQEVDLYTHNPDNLAEQFQELGDGFWYFFSPRERKYRKGKRPKRAAGNGYWKATGADKLVEDHGVVVGKKKSLVFYLGKPPNGKKTDWIMQEYTVDAPPIIKKDEYDMRLDNWVLCKIYKKASGKSKKDAHVQEEQQQQQQEEEQVACSVTSVPEEVAPCASYDSNLVEKMNCGYNSMANGYIQPVPRFSAVPPPPPYSDPYHPNYSNLAAYHHQQQQQQQQLANYRLQSVHLYPTQVIMSKYNMPDNFGSISTMDNYLLDHPQLEPRDTLPYYHGVLPKNPPTPPS